MAELQRPLYVVRHGESLGDSPDSPLTFDGEKHARQVAEFLQNKLGSIQVTIVSSPYERAKQTAMEISRILGVEYSQDIRLKERDLGDTSRVQKIWEEIQLDFGNEKRKFPGGESNLEVRKRVSAML